MLSPLPHLCKWHLLVTTITPRSKTDEGCLHGGPLKGGLRGRSGAAAQGQASPGGHPSRPRGHGERGGDLPLLRDQPAVLLQVAPPLRGARRGGAARRLLSPPELPERDQTRGGHSNRLPAEPLPLRAPQDRDVPRALSTTSKSAPLGSGGSSTSSECRDSRPPSATNATRTATSATRSSSPASGSKSM